MLDRRTFLAASAGAAAAAAFLPLPFAAAQSKVPQGAPEGFFGERPLPEMEQGSPDAPVVLTEYASVTCGHCKAFHDQTLPALQQYIDDGKLRYQLREFAYDPLAAAGFMLARCAPNGSRGYFGIVDILFDNQSKWTRADNPAQALFDLTRVAGFDQESFNKCLTDQKLLDQIRAVQREGEKFGVTGTPTLFVNGEKLEGGYGLANVKKAIDAKLGS